MCEGCRNIKGSSFRKKKKEILIKASMIKDVKNK
jgi:hypothetical protein